MDTLIALTYLLTYLLVVDPADTETHTPNATIKCHILLIFMVLQYCLHVRKVNSTVKPAIAITRVFSTEILGIHGDEN